MIDKQQLKREEPYECIVYLSFTANEDMNNGSSKPTQPCIPSGTHRNHNISSSPVGVSKNIHKQNKKAISHERACIGDTTTSALHASSSSSPTYSVQAPKPVQNTSPVGKTAKLIQSNSSPKNGNINSDENQVISKASVEYAKSNDRDGSLVSSVNVKSSDLKIGNHSTKPKLNWSVSADSTTRAEGMKGGNGTINQDTDDGGTSKDPVKSRKIVKHWKEVASMSKFGNRTKSLLGKFKPNNSMSVDMVASQGNNHSPQAGGASK